MNDERPKQLRYNIALMWIASRDPRTPVPARIAAKCAIIFTLSPIKMFPMATPVFGNIVEKKIINLSVIVLKYVSSQSLVRDLEERAGSINELPVDLTGLKLMITIYAVSAAGLIWLVWSHRPG